MISQIGSYLISDIGAFCSHISIQFITLSFSFFIVMLLCSFIKRVRG